MSMRWFGFVGYTLTPNSLMVVVWRNNIGEEEDYHSLIYAKIFQPLYSTDLFSL
jgi:hypothetical protein